MKRYPITLLILALCQSVSAQIYPNFVHHYDIETKADFNEFSDIVATYDDGYAIASHYFDATSLTNYIELFKINYNGEAAWRRSFATPYFCWNTFLVQLPDSGFAITANIIPADGVTKLIMIKTNMNGEKDWVKYYGENGMGATCHGLQLRNDNLYILSSGQYTYEGINTPAYFILKTDLNGSTESFNSYNWTGPQTTKAFYVTESEEIYVAGVNNSSQFMMSKINTDGNLVWSRIYSPGLYYDPQDLIVDGDNILITGRCGVSIWDVLMMKFKTNGDFVWGESYGLDNFDEGYQIFKSGTGYTILAEPESFENESKAALIHIDTLGNIEWMKLYGDTSACFPNGAVQTDDGFTIFGILGSYSVTAPIYLLKTDEDGRTSCQWVSKSMDVSSFTLTYENVGSKGSVSGELNSDIEMQINYSATYDDCIQVPEVIFYPELSGPISIYPNPFSDYLSINGNIQSNDIITIEIYNYLGELVYTEVYSANDPLHVDTRTFARGCYLLVAKQRDKTESYKLLKS